MRNKLFSILIANYNNGQYIEECLQSVSSQTYNNWEVIIVDDGSTDNSKEIYKRYNNNKKIKIFFNKTNKGCGYTKRECVELATGDICAFLDPDDKITPDAIDLMVKSHNLSNEISLVTSRYYLCDKHLAIVNQSSSRVLNEYQGYFGSSNLQVSHFSSFKKNLYNKTIGINPSLKRAVDQDLYYKLDEVGTFEFVDIPLYYYRQHSGGISTQQNSLKAKYWHAIVVKDTYKRRRKNKYPYNITLKQLRKYFDDYYTWKAIEKAESREFLKMYYCLIKGLYYETFTSQLKIKLRLFLKPLI